MTLVLKSGALTLRVPLYDAESGGRAIIAAELEGSARGPFAVSGTPAFVLETIARALREHEGAAGGRL